jgi:hypothetical protein
MLELAYKRMKRIGRIGWERQSVGKRDPSLGSRDRNMAYSMSNNAPVQRVQHSILS